jgi:hypothetical protein
MAALFWPPIWFDLFRNTGEFKLRNLSCCDQFLSMAFAQLTYREKLRDIETYLRSIARLRKSLSRSLAPHQLFGYRNGEATQVLGK